MYTHSISNIEAIDNRGILVARRRWRQGRVPGVDVVIARRGLRDIPYACSSVACYALPVFSAEGCLT